jgi:hypothetical protein
MPLPAFFDEGFAGDNVDAARRFSSSAFFALAVSCFLALEVLVTAVFLPDLLLGRCTRASFRFYLGLGTFEPLPHTVQPSPELIGSHLFIDQMRISSLELTDLNKPMGDLSSVMLQASNQGPLRYDRPLPHSIGSVPRSLPRHWLRCRNRDCSRDSHMVCISRKALVDAVAELSPNLGDGLIGQAAAVAG